MSSARWISVRPDHVRPQRATNVARSNRRELLPPLPEVSISAMAPMQVERVVVLTLAESMQMVNRTRSLDQD